MKYIVYRTTCLINNKIYVGVHHTDDPNIFDGYLGRGLWKNHTRYIKIQLQQYKLILPTYLVIGKQQGAKTVEAVTLIPW